MLVLMIFLDTNVNDLSLEMLFIKTGTADFFVQRFSKTKTNSLSKQSKEDKGRRR